MIKRKKNKVPRAVVVALMVVVIRIMWRGVHIEKNEAEHVTEPPADSEFLSFFVLYSRILAYFLSHLGKWVKLIKFEAYASGLQCGRSGRKRSPG